MTFVSYAQNFEDVLLWRALGDVEAGSYLDIGAQDPEFDSVSLAFYQAGWRGIHVEPTPAYAARLREERPDEVVIQAAVSEAPGPLELYEFRGTGLSTGKSEIAIRHQERGFRSSLIFVPCIRLDKILKMAGDIHWMKIDVEGMEPEVLRSWGRSSARPWVVVIEATSPMEQSPTDRLWRNEVEKRGYCEVYFDGLSRFFLHDSHAGLAERFAAPPNIFDGFQVSSRHFSTQQFAQDAGNEIGEAGRRAEQLQSELSIAHDQLEIVGADADQAGAERAAANQRASALEEQRVALSTEVAQARAEKVGAIEALAKATAEHSAALDAAWRERHAYEVGLREQRAAKEEEYRQADASREARLREVGMQAAALDERASQQANEIERLASAKGRLELQVAEFSKEIAELHASYRTEIKAHEELAWTERDRLFKELAKREVGLSAATATIDQRALEIDELKKAKIAVDRQVVDLNAIIAALHASHASEIGELEKRAERERERLTTEMASLDDQLTLEITRLREDAARERAALEQKFAESRTRAGAIEALIKTALAQPLDAWQRFGRALGVAREDGARQALLLWRPDQAAATYQKLEPDTHMTIDGEAPNPYLRANSLEELLAWHDVEFVRCAYVTVLGRQPDPEGEAYYTDRIRRGHSKMEVLWHLRRSPEGPEHDPGIAGLDKKLRLQQHSRLPLLGSIIRVFTGCEGDSAAKRQFRVLDNYMAAIRYEQRLGMSAIQRQQELHRAELDAIRAEGQAMCKSLLQLKEQWAERALQQNSENVPAAPHEPIDYCPLMLGPTTARLYKKIRLLTVVRDGPTDAHSN